jgi:serine protease Do
MFRKSLIAIVVIFVAIVAGIGVTALRRAGGSRSQEDNTAAAAPVGTAGVHDDSDQVVTTGLFRGIAKRENPIVVAITTAQHVQTPDLPQFGENDFFHRFFGGAEPPGEEVRHALGSGILIGPDEILTNNHVIAGAEQIRVALFGDDRKTYPADVEGRDPLTDSALIRLKNGPAHLPAATIGDSDALEPGDWVMAIGNPFQLGHTVTVGVISYKGRPFATTEGRFQNMLQTDASINPGNSGGPLIDVRGEVIGMNTAILSGDGASGNIGIGFAVPINTVKTLLPQLRKGSVQRGRLGVQILSAPVTTDEASSLGLPAPAGAIVSRVEPDSPADHAGLRAGDVIVGFNGKPVMTAEALTNMVVNTAAGTPVQVTFYRGGKQQMTMATIAKLDLENGEGESAGGGSSAPGFGVSLRDLPAGAARQLGLPAGTQGALVQNVEPFTPAANAGLQAGDVVLEVNRQPVHSAAEAKRQLDAVKVGQLAFVLVSRQGGQVFVEMRKE